jgi:hypothetical protein
VDPQITQEALDAFNDGLILNAAAYPEDSVEAQMNTSFLECTWC